MVIRSFHLFNIVKAADRYGIRAIRQASQHTGHHQANIAGIIRFTESVPLNVLGTLKVVANILDGSHLFHGFFLEEGRANRTNKRHMC